MTPIDRSATAGPYPQQEETPMPITTTGPVTRSIDTNETHASRPRFHPHWGWAGLWAFLAAFAGFEVIKHGFLNGSAPYAALLSVTALGFFVAPDLTFIIGASDDVEPGSISTRAVPLYNAAHRMLIALGFTGAIGLGLAPLAPLPLVLFVGGLSWMAHIALDRAAGYGLRNPDGSRDRR